MSRSADHPPSLPDSSRRRPPPPTRALGELRQIPVEAGPIDSAAITPFDFVGLGEHSGQVEGSAARMKAIGDQRLRYARGRPSASQPDPQIPVSRVVEACVEHGRRRQPRFLDDDVRAPAGSMFLIEMSSTTRSGDGGG